MRFSNVTVTNSVCEKTTAYEAVY